MSMDILSWLRQVDDNPGSPHQVDLPKPTKAIQTKSRKRQRSDSSTGDSCLDDIQTSKLAVQAFTHPTPPPDSPTSAKAAAEMSSSKRRKTASGASAVANTNPTNTQFDSEDVADEQEKTPRPLRRAHIPSDASSLSSASHSTMSGMSGASSPRKQLAAMALSNHGVDIRAMSDPSILPPSLADMRERLMQFGRGRGILGANALADVPDKAAARALHPDFAAIYEDKEFCCSMRRDELGLTPRSEDVLYILECAADCLRLSRSEPAWNHEVHFPLLCLALRPRTTGSAFKRLVKVTTCSTASVIRDYRIRYAPDKKIDFCVYLDPHYDSNDVNIAAMVDTVRAQLPLLSINPTDDLSLLCNPIAIPIETKRPGEGLDTANLQVATFLSSHFILLQRLVDAGAAIPPEDGQAVPSVDDVGFLPGLIIQGNNWNFIAASRQDSRTVIWSETSLGSTGDIFGIYRIIASLQLLQQWIDTIYWPWLRQVIRRAAKAAKIRDLAAE
ncbi:hypothetical protein ACHAPJ_012172 [Fusarium lateritium]